MLLSRLVETNNTNYDLISYIAIYDRLLFIPLSFYLVYQVHLNEEAVGLELYLTVTQ